MAKSKEVSKMTKAELLELIKNKERTINSLQKDNKQSKKDFLMAKKSDWVLYEERTHKDMFAFYIQTKNSDGSVYIQRFVKEKTVSKTTGNVYYKGYKELISAKEVEKLRAEFKATQSDKDKETVSKTESTPC